MRWLLKFGWNKPVKVYHCSSSYCMAKLIKYFIVKIWAFSPTDSTSLILQVKKKQKQTSGSGNSVKSLTDSGPIFKWGQQCSLMVRPAVLYDEGHRLMCPLFKKAIVNYGESVSSSFPLTQMHQKICSSRLLVVWWVTFINEYLIMWMVTQLTFCLFKKWEDQK